MIILSIIIILDNNSKNKIITMQLRKKVVKVLILLNIQIKKLKKNNQIMRNNTFK